MVKSIYRLALCPKARVMANQVPAWATHPAFRDRLYVERIPSAGASAAERWAVDGKAAYLVGRQAEAVDIPCQHKSASRVHACLAHRGERLFLVDLGSVHGEHGIRTSHVIPLTCLNTPCKQVGTCRHSMRWHCWLSERRQQLMV